MIEFFQTLNEQNDPRQLYIFGFLIFVFILLIFNFSFKNNIPSCNHYMLNIYLYIGLALSLIGTFTLLLEYYKVKPNLMISLLSFILGLVFIFVIHFASPIQNSFVNHFIWIILLFVFSYMIYPLVSDPKYEQYINRTIIIVALIFFIMSIVVYLYPKFFENTYQRMMMGLFIALLSIIIVEVVYLIYKTIKKDYTYTNFNRFITYIVIIIFTLLISYDTQRLKFVQKNCKEGNSLRYPNYPKESLGLILDIINLFVRILSLQGSR